MTGSQIQTAFYAAAPASATVNAFLGILGPIAGLSASGPNGDTWGHYLFGWDANTLSSYTVSVGYFWNTVAGVLGWPTGVPAASNITPVVIQQTTASVTKSVPVVAPSLPAPLTTPTAPTGNTTTQQQSLIGQITAAQQTTNSSTTPAVMTTTGSYFSLLGFFGISEPQLGSLPIGEYTAMLLGAGAILLMMSSGGGHHHGG